MSDDNSNSANDSVKFRKRALARWDNEGGAEPNGPQAGSAPTEGLPILPEYDPAEMASLHVRVVALETLLISLLATASERQLEVAGKMTTYIAPRPGFTNHPLTMRAAAHMGDLLDRASRVRMGMDNDKATSERG